MRDFQFGAGRLLAAGQKAENDVRGDKFGSQKDCQDPIARYVSGEIGTVLQEMWNEGHAKWDGFLGPYTWISPKRLLGF